MKKGRVLLYSYDTTIVEKYHNLLFHLQTDQKKKALSLEGSKRGKKKKKNTDDKGEGTGQNRTAR
jgi:hypothetical protein